MFKQFSALLMSIGEILPKSYQVLHLNKYILLQFGQLLSKISIKEKQITVVKFTNINFYGLFQVVLRVQNHKITHFS